MTLPTDPITITLILAILTLWLGLTVSCFAAYTLLTSTNGSHQLRQPQKKGNPQEANPQWPVLSSDSDSAWGVFVMIHQPGQTTNEHITHVLQKAGASFQPQSASYSITGDSPRYPIKVINAKPPGKLPSFIDDSSAMPIKALTVKIDKHTAQSTPNKLQMARMLRLARDIAKGNGQLLDAEKQPITEEGIAALIKTKSFA